MMCPWTQRCCPILLMSLGETDTTLAERETLKYAHIQTAIHVDENARETLAREPSRMDELYGKITEKKKEMKEMSNINDIKTEPSDTTPGAVSESISTTDNKKTRIRPKNKENISLSKMVESEMLKRLKKGWNITLGIGRMIDTTKEIIKPMKQEGGPIEKDAEKEVRLDYEARMEVERELNDAERARMPSATARPIQGGDETGLMELVKGNTPITKVQKLFHEEIWLPTDGPVLYTKDQLMKFVPAIIDEKQDGWKEWDRESMTKYDNPEVIKELEIQTARETG